MPDVISTERMRFEQAAIVLFNVGRVVFSLAIVGLGIETLVCARYVGHSLGAQYAVIPALPWLPAIPWVAYLFGAIWVACGAGLLSRRTLRAAAMTLGGLLLVCAMVLDVPKNAANFGSISLRTTAFEPLALASLAWLLPGGDAAPHLLARGSRFVLGLALVVFGVDHFLALGFIATLLPNWIPWHVFWVAFFGVVFIAGGVSIGLNFLQRWGAAGTGLMFGIWVVTLHLPRVLGLYAIPGAPRNPNEWSSLLIAVGLWGGLWALAGTQARVGAEQD
ncbi:MAG: hypothetical protein WCA27_23065 [Candidatus Sulfotelmatobacter sp.]